MKILKPIDSFSKLYRKQNIDASAFSNFKSALDELFGNIEDGQVEPTQRKFFTTFMEEIIPKGFLVTHEEDGIDVVIHTGEKTASQKGVIIELKSTTNKEEMVTRENINRKALQELLYYYLNERIDKGNISIKYLIACNTYECFVWDAQVFEKAFGKNKPLKKEYEDFKNNRLDFKTTDKFYEIIAKKYIDEVKDYLDFTYINIKDCYKQYHYHHQENSLKPLFKLLNVNYLMKIPVRNDSNELNDDFYRELLYVMGIEEWTDKETQKIRRIKIGAQKFSLMEQIWSRLEEYPTLNDDERFETAMGLLITWINRILFLKLLESQLISFGNSEKAKFLTPELIPNYVILDDLFLQVLAKPVGERDSELKVRFSMVPYLNSSLFEFSPIEQEYFSIGMLRLGDMEVYNKTVLKGLNGKRLKGKIPALKYLLSFLDAYDFGSSKVIDGVKAEKKTLINASVLGLIFEKINGYKDGSFFTPGYITEYICHKTLQRAVLNKFNETHNGWDCKDFHDLKLHIGGKIDARIKANDVINSLKICDPAVGSGHFLVSALNELIAIKSELGVLMDKQERPLPIDDYEVRVENDELCIVNAYDMRFVYKPKDKRSQQIQEALFEEKRTIIENCLFGVDLNPKSVDICQLRLWIELLKNAYYHKEGSELVLQTLPNIDINIKNGNSLAANHPVRIGKKITIGKGRTKLVAEYKENVREYKNCRSKELKVKLNKKIKELKLKLLPTVQLDAFSSNKYIVSRSKTMRYALEWMIEFPEVLDEDGIFQGFDVIVGNPPYISLEKLKDDSTTYGPVPKRLEKSIKSERYQTYEPRGDIYALFVERGMQLLRQGGHLSYILPNKWEKVMYGKPLRSLFLHYNLTHLIDFRDIQIFDGATTYTCIIRMKKECADNCLNVSTMRQVNKDALDEDVETMREEFFKEEMDDKIWITSSLEKFNLMKRIKDQAETDELGSLIKGEAHYGIKTGLTQMFLVSKEKFDELTQKNGASEEILHPFLQGRGLKAYDSAKASSYLLYIPKGFTLEGMGVKIDEEELKEKGLRKRDFMPTEDSAWEWFSSYYPAIAEWLLGFKEEAKARTDKGDYWWELRACDYYYKFNHPKIFYQTFQTKPCFVFDNSYTFCNNSMWFLSVNNKALLALLCSKMGWWLISEHCPRIQNGYQLIWDNFSQIPIPRSLPDSLSKLATEAEKATAENDNNKLEQVKCDIDIEVYHLYGLTYEDILIIDPETNIQRSTYEANIGSNNPNKSEYEKADKQAEKQE